MTWETWTKNTSDLQWVIAIFQLLKTFLYKGDLIKFMKKLPKLNFFLVWWRVKWNSCRLEEVWNDVSFLTWKITWNFGFVGWIKYSQQSAITDIFPLIFYSQLLKYLRLRVWGNKYPSPRVREPETGKTENNAFSLISPWSCRGSNSIRKKNEFKYNIHQYQSHEYC